MKRLVPLVGAALVAVMLAGPGAFASEVGFVDPDTAVWYLPDDDGVIASLTFGRAGHVPLTGDWDCDGSDTPGMFDPATGLTYVTNSSSGGDPELSFHIGVPGDIAVAGDWDGDGCDSIGVYRPRRQRVFLPNQLGGQADHEYAIGTEGSWPLVVDADGDGREEVAVYRSAVSAVPGDGVSVRIDQNQDPTLISVDFTVVRSDALASARGLDRLIPVTGDFGAVCGEQCGVDSRPALQRGDRGGWVDELRARLALLGFRPGDGDEYDTALAGAVMAFQKYHGTERTGGFAAEEWPLLDEAIQVPFRADDPNRVEIDLARQILFLIVDHQLLGIIPISSANGEAYISFDGATRIARTPEGEFSFYREEHGWYRSYLGSMYEPFFFRGGYAIHGSNSVPAYPASHGCIRTQVWDMDWLKPQLEKGMSVHVYGNRLPAPEVGA